MEAGIIGWIVGISIILACAALIRFCERFSRKDSKELTNYIRGW